MPSPQPAAMLIRVSDPTALPALIRDLEKRAHHYVVKQTGPDTLAVSVLGSFKDGGELADRALEEGDEKEWAFHSGVHAGLSNVLRLLVDDFVIDLDEVAPDVAKRSDAWRVEGESRRVYGLSTD